MALCNQCGKQSSMIPKVKVMKGKLKQHYFTCDHCNHIYTIGYTNEAIDRERNRVSKMKRRGADQDKIQTKVRHIETMMIELKQQME